MFLKLFKVPIILFLIGFFCTILGAWMKVLHYALADAALTIGLIVKGAAVFYAIYILAKTK